MTSIGMTDCKSWITCSYRKWEHHKFFVLSENGGAPHTHCLRMRLIPGTLFARGDEANMI